MNQVLHIFAKDSRRMRIEILVSLALMAGLVANAPQRWQPDAMVGYSTASFSPAGLASGGFRLLSGLLMLLIPLSWWVLVGPVIHEDRLVGDRQFWLTRPYEWSKLLAAKVLFVLAYLYAPLLAAQCIVLVEAGFQPFACLPGLFYNLVVLTAIILPLAVLAALTRNFARMTLGLLGVVVGLAALSWAAELFARSHVQAPIAGNINGVLLFAGCATALVLQYASRRAARAWIVLGVTVALTELVGCIAPDQALMERTYPVALQNPGVALTYREDPSTLPSASLARRTKDISISIPVHVSGVADGAVLIPQDLKVTLDAPDGSHWNSGWQTVYMQKYFPGERIELARFIMPLSVYRKLKAMPLHVRVALALDHAQRKGSTKIDLPLHDFAVPEVGICTSQTGWSPKPGEISGVFCRAPLREPQISLAESAWTRDDCNASSPHWVQGSAWIGSTDRPPAEFGIVPLWIAGVPLSNQTPDFRMNQPQHLCPGEPITFSTYAVTARTQALFDVQQFHLPELNAAQETMVDRP